MAFDFGIILHDTTTIMSKTINFQHNVMYKIIELFKITDDFQENSVFQLANFSSNFLYRGYIVKIS